MKRLIFATIVAISLLAGCGKDAPRGKEQETPDKSLIVFRDELGFYDVIAEEPEGAYPLTDVKAQIIISEYYQSQRVNVITIDAPQKDKDYSFEPNTRTEYVTVALYAYLKNTAGKESTFWQYIANAFYIDDGKDTEIVLKANTRLSTTEPKL